MPDMLLLLLFLLLQPTWAQPPPASSPNSTAQGFAIFLVAVAATFFFTGVVFVSFRRHLGYFLGVNVHDGESGVAHAARGLSQETVEAFPTYFYADVKVHRHVDAELECAICLTQFQDHEVLRLLPPCNHIFHPQCIDPWLRSHATCPVCRNVLEPSANALPPVTNAQILSIRDLISPAHQSGPSEPDPTAANKAEEEPQIVLDRFTLKLPDEARRKLESTAWRFAKASSGTKPYRSRTPESGRIEWSGLEFEPDRVSLGSVNRNWRCFVSQPASPLRSDV